MNFAENEEKILGFWKKNWIFHKTLKKDSPEGDFVFYEGPPTANGKPGIHHVEARAFKDLIPRYKTMRGYHVMRKAGWDTHGLPVELEVEKKLGLKNKKDIEEYGMGEFNQKCKQSVWEYKEDWEKMTERIGFWVDMADPYITYENDYVESLWWIISEANKKGLLYQGHKVIPNCPRCGTALSSHEVAQGYKNVTEESVYVKFKLVGRENEYILAWTTTPWTLPGNVALAVGEDIMYVRAFNKKTETSVILSKRAFANLSEDVKGYEVVQKIEGKDLVGLEYEPLFPGAIPEDTENYKNAYKVYPADFVSTEDGTGVVHTAVMYGIEDYELGEKIGLPKVHTVNLDGTFNELVQKWEGKFVKSVEKEIVKDLSERKLLYKTEEYAHDYPFCWRCDTPLIYYAKDSWFFAMSKLRDDLIKNNSKINWVPAHIKEGRFGEWLREVKDWSISRERYWGTPIPVWRCEKCAEIKIVSSVNEIREELGGYNNLFVTRHGESENNVAFINNSMPETKKFPLTEKGRKEAKETAVGFKNKEIDVIISSPIMRTKETAEIISKELGVSVVFDERLREVDLGEFNNKNYDELHKMYANKTERAENTSRGVESGVDIKKRTEEFISELNSKYENKNIVLVSHADVCQILFGMSKEVGLKESYELWYPDTGEVKHIYSKKIDLHRPFIDEVELTCKCEGKMKRIPEVMDCWFDAGSMPLAQHHYPFENKALIDNGVAFPADFICEAIDQTRGWFYTLLAVSTILGKGAPYKNVISLGHVLDSKGLKMSKSKGNVVEPMAMIDKYGADTLRWYLYTINQPGDSVLFDEKGLKTSRRVFMTLVNVLAFYKMFAPTNLKCMEEKDLTNVLDVWIKSKLNILVREVTENLDGYDITTSARKIENFINDLSTWYIRRSRDRFKNGDEKAMRVLRHVMFSSSKLFAPFAPFTSEYIYKEMGGEKKTVHLEQWPCFDGEPVDEEIISDMDKLRKIVSLALEARLKKKIKVRQPLASLTIKSEKLKGKEELLQLIKDEVNVKAIIFDKNIKEDVELDTKITDELKEEGATRELMRQIQGHRKKLGLKPGEQANIEIFADKKGKELIEKNSNILKDLNIKNFKFTEEKNEDVLLCLYN